MKALMVLIMHYHMALMMAILISIEITLQKQTSGTRYTCVLNILTALISGLSLGVATSCAQA